MSSIVSSTFTAVVSSPEDEAMAEETLDFVGKQLYGGGTTTAAEHSKSSKTAGTDIYVHTCINKYTYRYLCFYLSSRIHEVLG